MGDAVAVLLRVDPPPRTLAAYRRVMGREAVARIEALARPWRGLRVVHLNATAEGGGVAELLRCLVPLCQSLGVDASWYVLPPDEDFFEVTKSIHNFMQGEPGRLNRQQKLVYNGYLRRLAPRMRDVGADIWIVHDPQPLPLRMLVPLPGAAIWRCHIDCSTPNGGVREYLLPWTRHYDRAVFTMPKYIMRGLDRRRIRLTYPAIDPLALKNRHLAPATARAILARLGVDPARPLVTQVSRFDPWKNPAQAVEAYRAAKAQIPDLQLALVGVFAARDDPEAPRVYRAVRHTAGHDPDIHLFTDPKQIGEREVNAFQSLSTVIVQRSRREGFGLTVTEAMWKGRPVIATPVGGITAQIQHGVNGYLVETAQECAKHIVRLVREPSLANAIGRAARRTVRQHFLVPRLLEDELRLYAEVADGNGCRPLTVRAAR